MNKKLLLDVSALKLGENFNNLNDDQMKQYEEVLVSFMENFPFNEKKIKTALEAKDKKTLTTYLETLCTSLKKIQAVDLASEGREFLNVLKDMDMDWDKERIEAFISVFLVTVAMLTIDLHMAKYLEENTHAIYIKKKNENVVARGNKTILAVDDTAISLTLLKRCLEGEPCKLVCVNSTDNALQYLENNDPDMFILDIEMPKMNGYELAKKIRKDGHEGPIIFLTNYSSKEYVAKAMQAGASDFIVKPIYKEMLTEKISKYL
jgi:CheY-like chemotaxis protein